MTDLIPNDNAHQIEEELRGTLFRDPQTFIDSFNSRIIDSRNPEMMDLAERIELAYKNLVLDKREREFSYISELEVSLKDIRHAVEDWSILAQVQREVSANKEKFSDGRLYFLNKGRNTGILYAYVGTVEEDGEEIPEYEKIGKERSFKSKKEFVGLIGKDNVEESEDFTIVTSLDAVLSKDGSFIKKLHNDIPSGYKS